MTRTETIAFYRTHSRRLYNMSYRILLSREDAEEVMQDTILKYLALPLPPIKEQQVSAWLAHTCIRASIDRLRKRKRESEFLQEYAYESARMSGTEEDIPVEATAEQILSAMQKLDDPYRLVLTLNLVEGLDYQEISQYTGLKEVTLRSHILRGKKKLIELLKQDGKQI